MIEYCYDGGDLVRAFKQAACFVAIVGEGCIEGFYPVFNDDAGWTVCVVYRNDLK